MILLHIVMALCCIFVMIAALWIKDIVVAVDMAFSILVGGLFVPIMGAMFWKKATTLAANIAMVISTVGVIICMIIFGITSFVPIAVGMILSLVFFVIFTFVGNAEEKKKAAENWAEYEIRLNSK